MRKDSKGWLLEPRRYKCKCGAMAQHQTNLGSRRREVFAHPTPAGDTCPYYLIQEGVKRTNKALAAAGLATDPVPNAPIRFD